MSNYKMLDEKQIAEIMAQFKDLPWWYKLLLKPLVFWGVIAILAAILIAGFLVFFGYYMYLIDQFIAAYFF